MRTSRTRSKTCNTMARTGRPPNNPDQFWEHVAIGGPDECRPWTGALNDGGYGRVRLAGRNLRAHRVAWTLKNGPIPEGLCVLHACDNRPCCNMAHLFLAGRGVNNADRHAKGRNPRPEQTRRTGTANGMARLTEKQVLEIRHRRSAGVLQRDLAKDYRVSEGMISMIITGRAWSHI
jgi:hypothetical protein